MAEEVQAYRFVTRRNVFPPLEVTTDCGFVRSRDAMEALTEVARSYATPSSLFSVEIRALSEEPVLARYLSARAATEAAAPSGVHQWREDGLYVDDKKTPEKSARFELV